MIANLLEKISELEQQIVELKAESEKREKENKRWRSKDGDIYWLVGSNGKHDWSYELNRDSDSFRYDTHNYFQTEEEAQKYANALESERQLKKFADEHNEVMDWSNDNSTKYYLYYNYDTQSISIDSAWTLRNPRVIYFSSAKIAKQAIDEIGTDEIKEYLTYEW